MDNIMKWHIFLKQLIIYVTLLYYEDNVYVSQGVQAWARQLSS